MEGLKCSLGVGSGLVSCSNRQALHYDLNDVE